MRQNPAMSSHRKIPGLRVLLLLGAVTALLAVLLVWRDPVGPLVAAKLRRELREVPAGRVAEHLQQLRHLGDAGIEELVQSLASERAEVVRAAALELDTALQRWQSLPQAESSPRVYKLAEHLAKMLPQLDRPARREAARIAQRILLWPIDRKLIDGLALVEHCDVVVRAGAAIPPPRPETLVAAIDPRPLEVVEGPLPAEQPERSDDSMISGRPLFDIPSAIPPPPTIVPHEGDDALRGPQRLRTVAPKSIAKSTDDLRVAPPRTLPLRVTDNALPQEPQVVERAPVLVSPEFRVSVVKPNVDHLPDIDLMRALHSSEAVALAAEQELKTRGFRAIDIRLSRQLFDPDPKTRLQLVKTLPSVAGIDPRPWLLILADDEAQIVRQSAYSILATSRDPAVLERLREKSVKVGR